MTGPTPLVMNIPHCPLPAVRDLTHDGRLSTYDESVLKLSKVSYWGKCTRTGHPLKLPSPTKLAWLGHFPGFSGYELELRSPEPAMPELDISWASEEREELGDEEKEQEEEPEAEKEKEPQEPEEEDELLLCEEPESSKEPEGDVEELEGEKKLEPSLLKLNEEERELEYQRMIDN